MNSRQRYFLHELASILVGIMAFCITTILLFIGLFFLLGALQLDFILSAQLVLLFLISSIGGLIFGLIAGVKYYHKVRKSQ